MPVLYLNSNGVLNPYDPDRSQNDAIALVFDEAKEFLTYKPPPNLLIGIVVSEETKNHDELLFADFLFEKPKNLVYDRTPMGFETKCPKTLEEYVSFGTCRKFSVPCLDLTRERKVLNLHIPAILEPIIQKNAFVAGSFAADLERKIEERLGENLKCITVANGTDALEIVYRAVSEQSCVPLEDQVVLVPSFTFISTASAVKLAGLKVEFLDCSEVKGKYVIEGADLVNYLHRDVIAVVGVSLFGQIPDWKEFRRVINRFDPKIALIEDAAQSFGCQGSLTTLTDFSCTSFYPAKLLGCYGDGGAIVCSENDEKVIRSLANHGTGSKRYKHDRIGRNSRLDGIQAGILLEKLAKLDISLNSRQQTIQTYRHFLKPLVEARLITLPLPGNDVLSQFTVQVDRSDRDGLLCFLKEQKVDARIFYPIPCHTQKTFYNTTQFDFINSRKKCCEVLSLPAFPFMCKTEILFVISCIETYFHSALNKNVFRETGESFTKAANLLKTA
jgi:UDP-2-acetamido-2-deoxy-ribo-hexuluronate aminotransferase